MQWSQAFRGAAANPRSGPAMIRRFFSSAAEKMERYLQRGEASVQLPAVRLTASGAQLIRVENAQKWIAPQEKTYNHFGALL